MKFKYLLSVFFLVQFSYADNDEFGRLFTSPAERTELDSKRKQITSDNIIIEQSTTQLRTEGPKDKEIELSGFVLREDGQSMVWINGKSELSDSLTKDLRLSTQTRQRDVVVKSQGKQQRLKPGQVWDLEKNRIKESWEFVDPGTASQAEIESAKAEDD